MSTSTTILVTAWAVVFAAALALDKPIATTVRTSGLEAWMESHRSVEKALSFPGLYYCTAAVAIVACVIHPLRWRAGGFILLATLISGLNGLIKWIVGRTRPFKIDADIAQPFVLAPFRGGLTGLSISKNLCFPSGHAALAFATASALAILWPKSPWRWLAFVAAAVVGAERIAENAHWASDVVGAAALGVGGVHLIHYVIQRILPPQPEAA